MKVILVNGSPHKEGCTYTALHEAEKTLREAGVETELYWLGTKPVGGCIACHGCYESGKCVFGGCVNEFAEKARSADGFIFGSPVHYAGIAGNMKSFLDRLFFSTPPELWAHKPGAAVVSARRGGTTAAYEQLLKYFGISQMPIISGTYWNMVHGSKAEEAEQDLEGMQCMRVIGRNMAYALRCIEAGKQAGVEPPQQEKPVKMNFIR